MPEDFVAQDGLLLRLLEVLTLMLRRLGRQAVENWLQGLVNNTGDLLVLKAPTSGSSRVVEATYAMGNFPAIIHAA
jgi:hypothetical protein